MYKYETGLCGYCGIKAYYITFMQDMLPVVDGEKIADINAVIAKDRFAGEGLVLKKGKKTFHKITV